MAVSTNGSKTVTRHARSGPRRAPRSSAPLAPTGLPARRRWGRVAAGGVLALVGAWTAASLYASAGERVEVVVVARDVEQFAELDSDDLRVVRVAADPGVDTVPGADLDDLVGRMAATALPDGALLSQDQLVAADEQVTAPDEAIVGAELGPGAAPQGALVGGTRVMVVMRPSSPSGEGSVEEVEGWLADVGEPDANTGAREASLVVPADSAADVAAAAADARIAVVALEGRT